MLECYSEHCSRQQIANDETYVIENTAPLIRRGDMHFIAKDYAKALALYQQVVETWPEGRYVEFIAEQRAPELAGLMKTKSKTRRGTS